MPFLDLDQWPMIELAPGCHTRVPFGQNLQLSLLEMQAGAEIPRHQHPHEQGGIVLEGHLQLTIAGETRVLRPGECYLIPPDTPHQAVAVGGKVKVLDVFSPIREDYVALMKDRLNQVFKETL
jgi:quercetin dioxygenase-like cupin family protein